MRKVILSKSNFVFIFTLSSFFIFGQDVTQDQDSINNLQEVSVIGSRNKNRVATDTPVPVDIINVSAQAAASPQTDLTQILNYAAPSFTSNTTTVADGTDHIDPAQLRGLGPDQVLVLLNGKRRHTSSLVNINGTPGRGSVGTDLNAIPAFAIERLEVLRDGASAQYGSDAIAGVINVVMKRNTKKWQVALTSGGFLSTAANDHDGGWDGTKLQADINYGTNLGKKGFINITGSFSGRQDTNRAKDATGNIFNAYNAIEQRALEGEINITSLFNNINNTPNSATIFNHIKNFAPQVSYFTAQQQSDINSALSIEDLQTILNFDVTDNELAYRGLERSDFNMRVGQSKLKSGQIFVNSEFEISKNIKGYAFGGMSYRNGDAAGFYRRPNQNKTATSIYLNGFLPEIHSDIYDFSMAGGIKGKLAGLNFDLSNTYGTNIFNYTIENTSNATLAYPNQSSFDAGGLTFAQNTVNLDFDKNIDVLAGLNIAFGGEFRYEEFEINAGEESSWANYDINGGFQTQATLLTNRPTDFFGSIRPGGAQVFPGFRPSNALLESRTSVASYVDTELDITKQLLISAALRYEDYSDFGSTFNYKFATRYKLTDNINIRGAYATGFRAPSLHQQYFSATSTQFVGGIPFENVTFNQASEAAKIIGIPDLKEEESRSISAGFTAKIPSLNLSLTADGYYTQIDDRIIVTDQFTAGTNATLITAFATEDANRAIFFANGIDTETRGIEGVVSHNANFGNGIKLNSDLAITFSKTNRIGEIHVTPTLASSPTNFYAYYSEASRIYLEEAIPRIKASLNNNLKLNKFNIFLRNVYFGEVTDPNTTDVNGDGFVGATVVNGQAISNEHPTWGGKIITDLSLGYDFNKTFKLTLGANNLLDIYPDENYGPVSARVTTGAVDTSGNPVYATNPSNIDLTNSNQFVYSRNVSQFGQNGRFLFARINLTF